MIFFVDAFTGVENTQWWKSSQLIPEFKLVVEWFFEYLKESSSYMN
jgi:membrane protein required for colicin V production